MMAIMSLEAQSGRNASCSCIHIEGTMVPKAATTAHARSAPTACRPCRGWSGVAWFRQVIPSMATGVHLLQRNTPMHDRVKTACMTSIQTTVSGEPAPYTNRLPVQATAKANT